MKPKIAYSITDSLCRDTNLINFRHIVYMKVRNQYHNNVEFIYSQQIIFEGNLNYYSFNTFHFTDINQSYQSIMKPINLPSR